MYFACHQDFPSSFIFVHRGIYYEILAQQVVHGILALLPVAGDTLVPNPHSHQG